ncbi:MAG: amino acid adenylation domain-containing protein [Chloroflexota bacterium]
MKDLQQRIAALPQDKQALLALHLARAAQAKAQQDQILQRDPTTPAHASFAQRRLWFLDQFEPDGAFSNVFMGVYITGTLDIAVLHQCLHMVIARHESLRTTFTESAGEPMQVIAPELTIPLNVIDITCLSGSEREHMLWQCANVEAERPFNLSHGPLIRNTLLRCGTQEHVLLLTMHHIITDGWSMGIFLDEIHTLYAALLEGQTPHLPELPIQYVDFAVWQRQWLQGEQLDRQLAYWQKQLAHIPPLLLLPTDHPRPSVKSSRGAEQAWDFSESLTHDLKTFGQQEETTLFVVLLMAFQVLLGRYSGQDDICVGTPIANRNRTETERLIGFFANTLVMRIDLSDNPSFRDLIRRGHQVAMDAYAHQDMPLELLVEVLQPTRDMSQTPLFQVMFALQNAPTHPTTSTHLKMQQLPKMSTSAAFDLTLSVGERENYLRMLFEYSTDLFEEATIQRLMDTFQVLLKGIVAHPNQSIYHLPLLDERQQQQLLIDWNTTIVATPPFQGIHHGFEAQVVRTPNAVAIMTSHESITYQELNMRANQLAHHLRDCGVQPETIVGVCVERSSEMIVGLLGVLKAGGAYLPLDPTYPTDRIHYMLEDAQAELLLTQQALIERLPAETPRLVVLDTIWADIAQYETHNPTPLVRALNPAYIIYTSGSTGKPKGAIVPHGALINYIDAASTAYHLRPTERILQFASVSFDVSAEEIYGALLNGATLAIRPETMLDSLTTFLAVCKDWNLQVLNLPTAYWHELALALHQHEVTLPACIRLVIIGSERALPERFVMWQQAVGAAVQLINAYGPTETTIGATMYRAPEGASANIQTIPSQVPIGRPFHNYRVYLLDSYYQPVPVGAAGELYIGGLGVIRGYLNRAALTAERFVPDPFSTDQGRRLYRTGDLARYLPDGTIEFLGRADHQVKIRGFRIETDEIASVIMQHPTVQTALVIAHEYAPGDTRLIAYPVLHPSESQTTGTTALLREWVAQHVPEYMVPTAFVELETFPMTPNGKIDLKALPMPDWSQRTTEVDYVAPRTPVEALLVAIWQQLLGITEIGIYDNFFALGGHSLLATQVMSRVRTTFDVELPVRTLFETPTVASFTQVVAAAQQEERTPISRSTIEAVARTAPLPLSFAQQRLWFLEQLQPGMSAYYMPLALRLHGTLNYEALVRSFQIIVDRHESLRTTFTVLEGQPIQHIAPKLALTIPLVDLSAMEADDRELAIHEHVSGAAQQAFDLAQGPLVRGAVLRLAAEEHVLLLTLHHIITDGWSMNIMVHEFVHCYEHLVNDQPIELNPLALQYPDFAVWQRQWLQGEMLEHYLAYWRTQLVDLAPLQLPTERPRPAVQTYRGADHTIELDAELLDQLQDLSQREGVTLFMTLLTAWKVLLARYSGQTDIAIGIPIAGRNQADIEPLIGFFINTLVIRSDLSADPSFGDVLNRVRATTLDAYAYQDLPFEKLVEELHPERDLSQTPLFQVMFNMTNLPESHIELSELHIEPIGQTSPASKFDLTLYAEQQREGMRLLMVYNADLFSESCIIEMLNHLHTLLRHVVDDPSVRLSMIPLTPYTNGQQPSVYASTVHVQEWPAAAIEQSIVQRFEEQVQQYPTHVAVQTEHYSWTYDKLNRMANQVAHAILSQQKKQNARVGLLFEQDAPMIAGLLGALKAGMTYVPLDPTYPPDRLAYMLADSQASLLVTHTSHRELACAVSEGQVPLLYTDQLAHEWIDTNPEQANDANTLAYILYTSGSTGKPKGVMQSHRNVLHHIRVYTNNLRINTHDRLTLFSSYSFDAAVMDIFGALLNGATLYPLRVRDTQISTLLQTIDTEALTIFHSTPTVYRYLVDNLSPDQQLATVRLVVLGGEETQLHDIERYRQHFPPDCLFINGLGPTESTVTLQYMMNHQTKSTRPTIPVGYPVEHTTISLCNAAGAQVATYGIGEMVIHSPYVALGYWNQPEATKQAFSVDPANAAVRLYRTGDLGRRLPDGSIEFVGRADFQVKVRGHRIEVGEIESKIRVLPDVSEVVTVAREDPRGETQLIAYVVPHANRTLDVPQVQKMLKDQLPVYMVPAAFVALEQFPLTPTNKVDRNALPVPDWSQMVRSEPAAPPRTPIEELLVEIWSDILGRSPIGIYDDFFTLGGHSLLATQVMNQVYESFEVALPLRTLFEVPTIAGLAEAILQTELAHLDESTTNEMLATLDEMSEEELDALIANQENPAWK